MINIAFVWYQWHCWPVCQLFYFGWLSVGPVIDNNYR